MPLDSAANGLFQGIHGGIALFFYQVQKTAFAEHTAAGGESARVLGPVIGGLTFVALGLGGLFAWGYQDDLAFDEALEQMDRGEYADAAVVFEDYAESWDDPAAWCNLALCRSQLGEDRAAGEALHRCESLDPPFDIEPIRAIIVEKRRSGLFTGSETR
ncbi:MAG: hypothetical protein GY913_31495 [Proteobacteria bacterium]|nr:hypothetical protein [Pseudomonadota bacterium]MCP4921445.1 hypothetical protein [Pseudomonadota bacterium]